MTRLYECCCTIIIAYNHCHKGDTLTEAINKTAVHIRDFNNDLGNMNTYRNFLCHHDNKLYICYIILYAKPRQYSDININADIIK